MFTRSIAIVSSVFALLALGTVGCAADSASAEEDSVEGNLTSAARSGGYFETFEGADGNYFRLVAANGRTLLRSEAYARASGPDGAMESMLEAARTNDERRFQVLPANDGGFYIDVIGAGASTQIIATSEVYSSRAKAEDAAKTILGYLKGIASVRYRSFEPSGARFDLYKLPADEAARVNGQVQPFKFILRAENGESVLFSEAYATKDAAMNGILAVKNYGRLTANYEVMEVARAGAPNLRGVFTLKAHEHSAVSETPGSASNHQAVGFSEVYANKSNASRAAEAVRTLLQSDVVLNDLTQ